LKSGSLKFLKPSGVVQACNGIAVSFLINVKVTKSNRRKRKEYASCIKMIRNAYEILYGDPKGRDNSRGTDTGVEIILKGI